MSSSGVGKSISGSGIDVALHIVSTSESLNPPVNPTPSKAACVLGPYFPSGTKLKHVCISLIFSE